MLRLARPLTLACAAVLLNGCGLIHVARLPVPAELAQQTTPMPVHGLSVNLPGTTVSFGGFQAHEISGRFLSSTGLEVDNVSASSTRQGLTFKLRSEEETQNLDVSCKQGLGSLALGLDGELPSSSSSTITATGSYAITCSLKSAALQATLSFYAPPGQLMKGRLAAPGLSVALEETHDIEGGLPAASRTGIYFKQQGKMIAAVDTMNGARVWLPKSLGEPLRTLLAGSVAALLIQSDLREED